MNRPFIWIHKSASFRRGMLAPLCIFAALCLLTASCFASEEPLPNIAANENRAPAGRLESGVLTLHLELRKGVWHPGAESPEEQEPDALTPNAIETYSFAEEGHDPVMPGPLVRIPQGTELHVSVHNRLPVTVFVHGLATHPSDGKSVLQVAPDETKEARFAAGEPGTYLYWANTSLERPNGQDGPMSGAFIVDALGTPTDDRIFVIQVWGKRLYHRDFHAALTINGKSWPFTEHLHAAVGEPEHWRVINATPFGHPMHLHGFYYYVDAVGDGESEHRLSPADRRMVVTEFVDGHHTFDMTWMPERVGNWVFHCHIVDHMGKELSPVLYGPEGPPPATAHVHHGSGQHSGMSSLVMGITVTDDRAHLIPAKAVIEPAAIERQLYIRERPAQPYVPAGPGFFLQGVSQKVGAIGPPLVITRGERTAIKVFNELTEPTAIHWHGLEIESYYDGVPGWDGTAQRTTPAIAPGGSFTAYMTPPRAGTFIYHTHWHDMAQLTGGMYGALLVLEPGEKYDPATDKVFVLGRSGINEMHCPIMLNGSPQPGLMVLLAGQTYRFRLINITPNDAQVATSLMVENHPGKWRAIAKDGADLPPQQATVRDAMVTLSVGETYDFEFSPKAPGDYQLHFASDLGSTVTQAIAVVPRGSPFSVFAAKQ
jgi:FtsP/CotA-like multicopper oxidase with cupredoxin domain